MPASLPTPRLRAQVEWADAAGGWVALVFDVVDGAPPALPWTAAAARRVMTGVADFAAQATPCPLAGLPPLTDRLSGQLAEWWSVAADPPPDLTDWGRERLGWLFGLVPGPAASLRVVGRTRSFCCARTTSC